MKNKPINPSSDQRAVDPKVVGLFYIDPLPIWLNVGQNVRALGIAIYFTAGDVLEEIGAMQWAVHAVEVDAKLPRGCQGTHWPASSALANMAAGQPAGVYISADAAGDEIALAMGRGLGLKSPHATPILESELKQGPHAIERFIDHAWAGWNATERQTSASVISPQTFQVLL